MSDYGFTHAGRVFTPNGTAGIDPAENDRRNAEIAAAELRHVCSVPDLIVAYYSFPAEAIQGPRPYRSTFYVPIERATVTLWTGTKIGIITSARVTAHNFGGRFVSLVANIGGTLYHGRASWDHGDVIKLRKCKRQPAGVPVLNLPL